MSFFCGFNEFTSGAQLVLFYVWKVKLPGLVKSSTVVVAERIRYLTLTDASKVWMPDTFFRNEKIGAFHEILTPNLYIRVFPDGDVLYSIR